jgi:cyclopropane fatty-acyl-phospholipid synthase-like methyltransferase
MLQSFGQPLQADYVDSKGIWHGTDVGCHHAFDPALAQALSDFFKKQHARSIVDFGCGLGHYQLTFLQNGLKADAYDGNPDTPALTDGRAGVKDLSVPFNLGKRYDWVMSLEVGEHLPKEYERVFIENLIRHAKKGIVLSWAIPGQGGYGHFNEQSNEYIKSVMTSYGWHSDETAENALRASASLWWFKNTVMVFRKKN